VTLSLYDVFGRKIETIIETNQVPDTYKVSYSTQNLSNGMYVYKLKLDNKVVGVRKMIIARQ